MSKLKLAVLLVFWSTCSYLSFGMTLGSFSHEFPWQSHTAFAVAISLGGPIALGAALASPPYHWLTNPLTVEERWQAFHAEFPNLTRDYFERKFN